MTDITQIDFEKDAESTPEESLQGLGFVSKLGLEASQLEDEIAELEQRVKEKKARLTAILERDLPNTMQTVRLESVTLDNKRQVKVVDFVRGSIPEEKAPAACTWLREHKHDGIIRRTVAVEFKPGQDKTAEALVKALTDKGFAVANKETVHHSTLASWAKEMIKQKQEFPADLFGLFIGRKAVIK